jgi:hypothetical protein
VREGRKERQTDIKSTEHCYTGKETEHEYEQDSDNTDFKEANKNARMKVTNTTVKKVDKFVYSEIKKILKVKSTDRSI